MATRGTQLARVLTGSNRGRVRWIDGVSEIERLGAGPSVVLARSGHDPLQGAEAFSCPMAGPEPAPEDGDEEP